MGKGKSVRRARSRRPARGLTPLATPVPQHYVTKMLYFDDNFLTEAGAGVGTFHTYCLNSLYDPNVTGVGTQPVTYDQWSAMYNRFRVVKVDVKACMVNASVNALCSVGYICNVATVLPANAMAWPCQRYSDSQLLPIATAGPALQNFEFSIYPWDVVGLTRSQYFDEADYSHAATSGPLRPIFLHLFVKGTTQVAGCQYSIRLCYHVEVAEPVSLTVS